MTDSSILVLTTGGTFDKEYFDALSEYQVSDSMARKILEVGRVTRPYEIREVARKDSLDLDESDRFRLVRCIEDSAVERIVVIHGTDTMTDTASSLATVAAKTIVLVGALSPARFAESDATFNLGMAFAAAQLAAHGVYIAMNGSVFSAGDVRKDRKQGAFVRL